MPKTHTWYDVPAGTQPGQCKAPACKAVIYWIVTGSGARMPVDCEEVGGFEPEPSAAGRGVAHWGTCADPEFFRRKK